MFGHHSLGRLSGPLKEEKQPINGESEKSFVCHQREVESMREAAREGPGRVSRKGEIKRSVWYISPAPLGAAGPVGTWRRGRRRKQKLETGNWGDTKHGAQAQGRFGGKSDTEAQLRSHGLGWGQESCCGLGC